MKNITLDVEGMSCDHCVSAITGGLMDLDGVKEVNVSLEKGTVFASFEEDKVSEERIKNTIDDLGYVVK